jgi:predicted amidophosphoribosyltransferase
MNLERALPPAAGAPWGGGPPGTRVRAGGLGELARWCRASVFEPVVSVLFPPRCVGCGDFESHLCARCQAALVAIGRDCCPRCGEPGPRPLVGHRCSHCMGLGLAYSGARSAFVHEGVAKRLVVEFKSGGQPVLAPLMAGLAAPAFGDLVAAARAGAIAHAGGPAGVVSDGTAPRACRTPGVAVTWVSSHPAAQRERGYNQAEMLAKALSAAQPGLVAAGLTRKPVRTKHQKALGRAGRQSNLRGAFIVDEKALLALPFSPAALVLVDDVFTTGATAQEVSLVLATAAQAPVFVFTFSRAVSRRGEGHD